MEDDNQFYTYIILSACVTFIVKSFLKKKI